MKHFFAYLSKLKYIQRWNLMRNTCTENVMEHTCETAMIAQCLVTIENVRYGGNLNPDRAASLALYHEAGEVITGDLATPIKYFNPEIKTAFKQIEGIACRRLLAMLPDDLQGAYRPLVLENEQEPEWCFVKAADRICAYLKCVEELKQGNREFEKAAQNILESIKALEMKAVSDFMSEFAPSYKLALDELN